MTLKVYLLGQFKLQVDAQELELPSRPAQSLLAYLALNAGVTQRREKLAGQIWPEASESNARGYLRQALWRIRKCLGSGGLDWEAYLKISDIDVVFLKQSDYWLDAEQLLSEIAEAQSGELSAVLEIYVGELLPGFYDEWVEIERDRLAAAFQQKINLLLESLVAAGEWQAALRWSENWIRLGGAPEPAYRAMMRAYAGLADSNVYLFKHFNQAPELLEEAP